MRIMSLHKQMEHNKGLFMYRVLNYDKAYTPSLTLFQLLEKSS